MTELKKELKELEKWREELESYDNVDEYNAMIDELHGDIDIMGMKYQTSKALKELDTIAYRCGHSDYNDVLLSDVNNEIDGIEAMIRRAEDENLSQ